MRVFQANSREVFLSSKRLPRKTAGFATRRTVVAKLELALQRSADPFSFEATSARGSSGTEVFVDSKSSSGIAANLLALQFGKTFQTVVGRIFASETQDHNLSVAKSYQS